MYIESVGWHLHHLLSNLGGLISVAMLKVSSSLSHCSITDDKMCDKQICDVHKSLKILSPFFVFQEETIVPTKVNFVLFNQLRITCVVICEITHKLRMEYEIKEAVTR